MANLRHEHITPVFILENCDHYTQIQVRFASLQAVSIIRKLTDELAEMNLHKERSDLYVAALSEIKAVVDGRSTQSIAAILDNLLDEINKRSENVNG